MLFQFTNPLYELLAREVGRTCEGAEALAGIELFVEVAWPRADILFRFMIQTPKRRGGKIRLGHCRMMTWGNGGEMGNDFDPQILNELL